MNEMMDIAPLIFRSLCRQVFRGEDGKPLERPALGVPANDSDSVRKWLMEGGALTDLPGVRLFTDEPNVHPHLVLRPDSATGGDGYLGIDIRTLAEGADGDDRNGVTLDYGDLPPCGLFKAERADGKHIYIKGYYLFILFDPSPGAIRTMALCDGDFLNDDMGFLLQEEKAGNPSDGCGAYGEGAGRKKASYLFPNPLYTGISELVDQVTLIHTSGDLNARFGDLHPVHRVKRVRRDGSSARFFLYRYDYRYDDPAGSPTKAAGMSQPPGTLGMSSLSEIELFSELKDRKPAAPSRRRFVVRE